MGADDRQVGQYLAYPKVSDDSSRCPWEGQTHGQHQQLPLQQ